MIPISSDRIMEFTDNGVTYQCKPLTDEAELATRRVQRSMRAMYVPYMSKAAEIVSCETFNSVEEKETATRNKAIEIARLENDTDENDRKEIEALNNLIDTVIVGWKSNRGDIVQFPEGKNPSKCFKLVDKYTMFSKIMEINSLSDEEVKN